MKRVSVKLFFTVLWRGVCQALGWFFGLFGYKRDGKFAKCVWGLFATSATIITLFIAGMVVCELVREVSYKWDALHYNCDNPYCYDNTCISGDIYYHRMGDNNGFVYNIITGEKFVKHVAWIAEPVGDDSLVCFSNGEKRGYFSRNTGKVVIEPKYDHAWIFSDGLASVDDGGYIKFIDATGKVVIDKKIPYVPDMDGYVFHNGYCVTDTEDSELCGLMNRKGEIVLPQVFTYIYPDNTEGTELWVVQNGEEKAVYDKDLQPVLPLIECSIFINEGTIDVTMPDHTMRKYALNGELIHDFYISSVRMLEYEMDEIRYQQVQGESDDEDGDEYGDSESQMELSAYHPKATARLRAYVAGHEYEGLMTADGQKVTMPLYKSIEAIGPDLYLCASTNGDKVIVNGKGEMVE